MWCQRRDVQCVSDSVCFFCPRRHGSNPRERDSRKMQCKDDKVKDLRLRLLRMVDEQDDHPHQTFASLRWHAALGQGWRRTPFPSFPYRSHEQRRDGSIVWLAAHQLRLGLNSFATWFAVALLVKGSETTGQNRNYVLLLIDVWLFDSHVSTTRQLVHTVVIFLLSVKV